MTGVAHDLFVVPPFPGGRPYDIVRPVEAEMPPPMPGDASALISAMRRHRIGGAFWLGGQSDPWAVSDEPWTGHADDPQSLLAAIVGRPLQLSGGHAFLSLNGLSPGSAAHESVLEALVSQHLLANILYRDPFTGTETNALAITAVLGGWRQRIERNRGIVAAFGFAAWKRDTVAPLLWGGRPVPFLAAREDALADIPPGGVIAVWKARVPPAFLTRLETGPWRILEVEDGFIRSAGLGADCVPPLSIVVDESGVHYDPGRANGLETMLARASLPPDDLDRARTLRHWLVSEGISKYGVGNATALPRAGGARRHILVVGQVEDDRSVLTGGGDVQTNLALLRRVRTAEPDAFLIYRPHPDVEAGHRHGAIPKRTALILADAIDANSPISALIAMVDEVHVITSLAGFEALMHGKKVTTHGTPFFAGWGLTRDLGPVPERRGRARSIDELTCATLLRYPLYLDPVTNLPCTAEVLVMRLLSGVQRRNRALVPIRQLFGWIKRAAAQISGRR